MSSWFRSRAPGTRSPARPTPTFECGDRLQTPLLDSDHGREDVIARDRATSRVSSLLSFGKSSSSALTSTPSNADATFAKITDPDSIWYKPNLEQMIETMITVMMTKESCAQVPADYNSCILHILEGYRDLRQQLKSRNEELAKLKALQDTQMAEFEKLGLEWALREKDYKGEVKKLEILLANGPQGLEAVSLARASSVVHDRPSGESIEEGIERIKSQSHRGPSDKREPLKVEFGTDKDIKLSHMLAAGGMTDARLLGMNSLFTTSTENSSSQQQSNNQEHLKELNNNAGKARKSYNYGLEPQDIHESHVVPSCLKPQNMSALDWNDSEIARLGLTNGKKPLPDIPTRIQTAKASQQFQPVPLLNDKQAQEQQRFSFIPGGDLEEVVNRASKSLTTDAKTIGPMEDCWGFAGRGDSKSSIATVIRDEPSESMGKPNNAATIAAKRAIASRSNTG